MDATRRKSTAALLRRLTGSKPSGVRVKAIVNPVTGMNKTETAYSIYLRALLFSGAIVEWKFEAIKLRLADNTFYTPDFAILLPCGTLELHDVKGRGGDGPGGWEDDAKVKIKVAATLFPWFKFVGTYRKQNVWIRTEF